MDIRSGCVYPASQLSNFAAHRFVFDDVECESMEGLLQALKYEDIDVQTEICKLVGFAAKKRGMARNEVWQQMQTLWWKGVPMHRSSAAYQQFLDRAYRAMFDQNEDFRKAVLATGDVEITHSIGKQNEAETVLTEAELCFRLMNLRTQATMAEPDNATSPEMQTQSD